MGTKHDTPGRRTSFGRVVESNELRLEELDRKGIPLIVDGRRMLQFFFERALVSSTPREFEHDWALNVAGLVKQFEADAHATEVHARDRGRGRGSRNVRVNADR